MTAPRITGRLVSIQVGLPQTYESNGATDARERSWTTGFYKKPVSGPVFVGRTNIEGDRQADLSVHGGPDKAVLAYSADHYEAWRSELHIADMPFGSFGENLTIGSITESDVCLGDVWRIGDVLFEVSQPRQPCWKLARRWQNNLLPKLVVQNGRSGWYYRVLSEGIIEAGWQVLLVERRHPAWSIARANRALYQGIDRAELMELSAIAELSRSWLAALG
jgi:MOSC domain-containing protein YiiM